MLWFDGRLQTSSTIAFDLSDRGLTLGDGVFDTTLSVRGCIIFEAAHISRLVEATGTLGFSIEPETVRCAMRAVSKAVSLKADKAVIRTTVTRGSGPRGLAPPENPQRRIWTTAVAVADGSAFASMTLLPTAIRRNETSPTSRMKTLGYLDAIVAVRNARESGFDDALFLNTKDRVSCTGSGNIFLIAGSELFTPPLSDGVLPGIVRAEVLRLGASSGLRLHERSLTARDFDTADAVFVTNSLRGLGPVSAIGAKPFASSDHPIVQDLTRRLRESMRVQCEEPIAGS